MIYIVFTRDCYNICKQVDKRTRNILTASIFIIDHQDVSSKAALNNLCLNGNYLLQV